MTGAAIDASALLAVLRSEPGADVAMQHLRGGLMSAVNLAEVLEKSHAKEHGVEAALALVRNWQLRIVPFDVDQAVVVANIKARIGNADVSLADRACLALGITQRIPVLTADRHWRSLPLEVEIRLIRGALH